MNDDFMLNLFRQREKEILQELEGHRVLKAQHAGGREKRAELWCHLESIVVFLKRGICRQASRAHEMMDPMSLKDQTMQQHPEL